LKIMIFYPIVNDRGRFLMKSLLLPMKLIVLLTFLNICLAFGEGIAQKVTLKGQGVTLVQVMRSIQKQTGKQFFLNGQAIASLRIDINIQGQELTLAMENLLKGKSLSWEMQDDIIVVRPSAENTSNLSKGNPGEQDEKFQNQQTLK